MSYRFGGAFAISQGNQYVLTMIDRTTRWAEAVPLPDCKADTVTAAFTSHWVARFGIPNVVTTDRGVQFTSTVWSDTLKRMGISATTTTAYYPPSNGMVERYHRTLKAALRCSLNKGTWSQVLPWVLLGLRNAPKEDTGTSAAEVLYGMPLRVPGACFKDERPGSAPIQELREARANVDRFLPRRMDDSKFKQTPFIPRALNKAEFIYVRDCTKGRNSLSPLYAGPYRVTQRDTENGTFKIQTARGPDRVAMGRLKAATVV